VDGHRGIGDVVLDDEVLDAAPVPVDDPVEVSVARLATPDRDVAPPGIRTGGLQVDERPPAPPHGDVLDRQVADRPIGRVAVPAGVVDARVDRDRRLPAIDPVAPGADRAAVPPPGAETFLASAVEDVGVDHLRSQRATMDAQGSDAPG